MTHPPAGLASFPSATAWRVAFANERRRPWNTLLGRPVPDCGRVSGGHELYGPPAGWVSKQQPA